MASSKVLFSVVMLKAQEAQPDIKIGISINCTCVILTWCFERYRVPWWQNMLFLKLDNKNTFSSKDMKLCMPKKEVWLHKRISESWFLWKKYDKQLHCFRIFFIDPRHYCFFWKYEYNIMKIYSWIVEPLFLFYWIDIYFKGNA